MKSIYLPALTLAIASLTSCTSVNAIKQGNPLGVVSAPFELAQNIVETTSVLHGEEPTWSKQLPKTYVDSSSGAKTVFPKGYNYGSVSWNGAKDEKGYATGRGTLKTFSPSGAYAFSESGTMNKGTWLGNTKETDKQGKEWKCVWQNGFQTSRARIYTSQELEQQRIASIARSKRQKEALDRFGRWLGDAMSSSSSGSGGGSYTSERSCSHPGSCGSSNHNYNGGYCYKCKICTNGAPGTY